MRSLDQIYETYAGAVYLTCLRAVSRREIAEELTGEVFLALHREWESVPEEQLPGWLFTVAKRRAADYWRSQYREQRWLDEQKDSVATTQPEFELEVLLLRCPQLKPIHRICTTLRFAYGMSRSEIAGRTNLTEMQVKGHLQYALRLLKEHMSSGSTKTAMKETMQDG